MSGDTDPGEPESPSLLTPFAELAAMDAAEVCLAEMGETVQYRPGGGGVALDVPVVVMREPIELIDGRMTWSLRLKVARGQVLSVVEPGEDVVELAPELGKAVRPCRVQHVDHSEPGSWILAVSA